MIFNNLGLELLVAFFVPCNLIAKNVYHFEDVKEK